MECFGDGLCCTDVHAIGTLNDDDVAVIELIAPEAIIRRPDDDRVLLMRHDTGACVFLQAEGCAIHANLGPEYKPRACRQFPLGVTSTPTGMRLVTEHRCPCRTIGDRPKLTATAAMPSVTDDEGEILVAHEVDDTIEWDATTTVGFAEYEKREAAWLKQLQQGKALGRALGAEPFFALRDVSWGGIATKLAAHEGRTRLDATAQWVGDALLFLTMRTEPRIRTRLWSDAFDRAASRAERAADSTDSVMRDAHTGTPESQANLAFGDWLSDHIWSMQWTARGPLSFARAELATRLVVARTITHWLLDREVHSSLAPRAFGVVAAGEAIAIVDTFCQSDWWDEVIRAAST